MVKLHPVLWVWSSCPMGSQSSSEQQPMLPWLVANEDIGNTLLILSNPEGVSLGPNQISVTCYDQHYILGSNLKRASVSWAALTCTGMVVRKAGGIVIILSSPCTIQSMTLPYMVILIDPDKKWWTLCSQVWQSWSRNTFKLDSLLTLKASWNSPATAVMRLSGNHTGWLTLASEQSHVICTRDFVLMPGCGLPMMFSWTKLSQLCFHSVIQHI